MTDTNATPLPTPTGFCLEEALETVWAALERLPEGALSDDDRDNLNTAMAWLQEAAQECIL